MIENVIPSIFSLNVRKFDLHLLKQNIFRALKRDLERAYLMIAGQSWHFTSCYWRCNLCTAIFYRRMWSMNSKEWLQTFYAFKFCSPTVFKYKRTFCELYMMRNIKTESRILSKTWLCISVVCGSLLLILSYLSFPEIYFKISFVLKAARPIWGSVGTSLFVSVLLCRANLGFGFPKLTTKFCAQKAAKAVFCILNLRRENSVFC